MKRIYALKFTKNNRNGAVFRELYNSFLKQYDDVVSRM